MNQKDDILRILSKNKDTLYSKYPIKSLAIFGSVAREEENDESDVDVLVEFNDNIGIKFIDLADEIESLLNRHVDLVSKKAVKPKYYETIKDEIIYV
ncbi:MAG: nucleotidyltransferase family protein [Balneolaceae bacterium]|nr:nucleotidyltransferase family protein [Balneolaceae bacterium]